ncbi:hypothetical protein [Tepidibacillus fermentans]|uniref:Uncharacterized protein n=1 Tax=Tepidibacillus fermentans TaxID=1281767 RepID=A0A4R3KDS7_9BACI|nr:hypothetical protein [Tepidibacillus fermentans]TCS81255.1 hypothetical protein EDD72_11313 [Tepidibacillus fermentans]
MLKRKRKLTAIMVLIIMFVFTVPGFAANQNIIERKHTNVSKNQSIENVVVIGNNATIEGTVRDAVIVINGDLTIKQSAQIQGLVMVLGGEIHQEHGARVTDNILNLSFHHEILNSLLLGLSIIIGIWIVKFGLSILLILLLFLTVFLANKRLDPIQHQITESPKRLILIGIATSILFFAVSILLTITVIGIPIVVILLAITLGFLVVSLATLSKMVGAYLLRNKEDDWKIPLVGASALVAGINFPFFGGVLFMILVWFSMGIMTLSVFKWMKRKI